MTDDKHTRRNFLAAGGGAAGLLVLSACGSDQPPAVAPPPPQTPGQSIAALSSVPVGSAVAVPLPDGKQAIVARSGESTVAAFSAACTHKGCPVAPNGAELKCPCHGSVFDAMTGAVKHGPAEKPLTAIPVHIENDHIVPG